MFSSEPANVVGRAVGIAGGLIREYHVCSSRSASWPSHINVGRLLQIRYSPSPLLWSEYSHTVSTNGGSCVSQCFW